MLVFFIVPFTLRGARVSVQSMKNDVRDWLPSTFVETREMAWFWKHFIGERFIVASWPTCREDDESYNAMLRWLAPQVPPSIQAHLDAEAAGGTAAGGTAASETAASETVANGTAASGPVAVPEKRGGHNISLLRRHEYIGDKLGLFFTGNDYRNWGHRDEKWVEGKDGLWYFLTPDGMLYEWSGGKSPVGALASKVWRTIAGGEIEGKLVTSFGPVDGAWYYEDPRRLDAQLFRSVTTGPTVLAGLTGPGGVLEGNEKEARRRIEGSLFSKDSELTCLMIVLSDQAAIDLHRVIGRGLMGKPLGRLYDVAALSGVATQELHLGGPTVDNVAIDEEGSVTLMRLVSLCVILGVTLAYLCFRTISATIIIFFVGGISAVSSIALVGWAHQSLDAILMSMPSLVYVLAISGAVHLMNYYREAVEEHGLAGAPEAAVSHGWKPAIMCNLTTAIGLFSLFTSDLTPIRKFGLFSGIAVLSTLLLLFTYLPAALQIWPQRPRTAEQKRRDENPWYEKYLTNFWNFFGGGIIRHHYAVSTICVVVIAVVGWGMWHIRPSVNMLRMFDGHAKILKDYDWLELNLGKLVPMEVVVKVQPRMLSVPTSAEGGSAKFSADEAVRLNMLERMELAKRIENVIEEQFGEPGWDVTGHSFSAATFAPVLPSVRGDTRTFALRSTTARRLEGYRDDFLNSEYLRLDQQDQSELWRISMRVGALQNLDYGEFVAEVKHAVEPVMTAHRDREALIRKLLERPEAKAFARTKVLLVGAPLGAKAKPAAATSAKSKKKAAKASDNDAAEGASQDGDAAPATDVAKGPVVIREQDTKGRLPVQQTKVYARTLKDLLTVARLPVDWHDPAVEPLPEDWKTKWAGYDCVILVSDHEKYDMQQLKSLVPLTFDLRDHQYKQETSKTAAEQNLAISAIYTGVVPIVYKAQRTLLNSLIESTFWSLVTITPLMMFISRSVPCGIIAMLPNVLPIFVIFGAMGWAGISVDIGSMMTASIALGVAVDDTIHYLTWFRWELDSGKSRFDAILGAYKRCATPTFQAAIISGLGLSIFAFSTFVPTQRFGYLMLTILFMGVVAELVFFPALLAGPLGTFFKPRRGTGPIKPPESIARELKADEQLGMASGNPGSRGRETSTGSATHDRHDAGHTHDDAAIHVHHRQSRETPKGR
jgi:predicted RND superfamily exporter protein